MRRIEKARARLEGLKHQPLEVMRAADTYALAVLRETRGYFEGACGEHCGPDHEHCALDMYRTLRERIKALGSDPQTGQRKIQREID